jgi:hypothetical protein
MAGRAIARTLEQGSATSRVADHLSTGLETAHVAKIRDDAGKFRGAESEGLHGCARDAVRDGKPQVIVRDNAFKLPGAKIDAGNHVAVLTVTRGALRSENLRAVLNVGLEILRCAVLPLGVCG